MPPIGSWNSCAPTCWNWPLCVLLFMLKALSALPQCEEPMLAVEVKPFPGKTVVPSDSSCLTAALPWSPEPPASDRIPQMGKRPCAALLPGKGLSPSYFCLNDDARTSVRWADAGLERGNRYLLPSQPLLQNPHTKSIQNRSDQLTLYQHFRYP